MPSGSSLIPPSPQLYRKGGSGSLSSPDLKKHESGEEVGRRSRVVCGSGGVYSVVPIKISGIDGSTCLTHLRCCLVSVCALFCATQARKSSDSFCASVSALSTGTLPSTTCP